MCNTTDGQPCPPATNRMKIQLDAMRTNRYCRYYYYHRTKSMRSVIRAVPHDLGQRYKPLSSSTVFGSGLKLSGILGVRRRSAELARTLHHVRADDNNDDFFLGKTSRQRSRASI